ncbi:hypothetical protein NL676_038551 [Syzygium grande]|nr:hypothetical protein NL676_038551 [Syzygium grande]
MFFYWPPPLAGGWGGGGQNIRAAKSRKRPSRRRPRAAAAAAAGGSARDVPRLISANCGISSGTERKWNKGAEKCAAWERFRFGVMVWWDRDGSQRSHGRPIERNRKKGAEPISTVDRRALSRRRALDDFIFRSRELRGDARS